MKPLTPLARAVKGLGRVSCSRGASGAGTGFSGKTSRWFCFGSRNGPPGILGRPVREPRAHPVLPFPPRSPLPGRREVCNPRSLPPADCRGSRGDSELGSPGGLGRGGGFLGWLQSVRACAWLALARLQPSSQEPPASTQRVQTDDCHWLRFEARGILLTEKSDTPGGRGEKGAAAQTRGWERGRGKRLYPALLISIKIRGGAKAFAPKATCFFFAERRLQSWEAGAVPLPPLQTPGLAAGALCEPAACRAVRCSARSACLAIAWH